MKDWENLSDEALLKKRICDLGLTLDNSMINPWVDRLSAELLEKQISFKPHVYLGDEWFSPEGVPNVSVPFYLAHPRLRELERKIMFEVEGENEEWFLRLIRHEAGHCFDHAFEFSRRKKWREIFGSPKKEYDPDHYRPRPYSKAFVKNIAHWYAQSHPDEDFAETFAVWLNPAKDWEKEYSQWPIALKKIKYIESLARQMRGLEPKNKPSKMSFDSPYSCTRMTRTLASYYQKRKKENAAEYPDFYDGDLKTIFSGDQALPKREFSACRFLHRHRKKIIEQVDRFTGEKKFVIDGLVKKFIDRSEQLDLRLGKPEIETALEVSAFFTSLISNYLFTGKFKRNV